MGTYGGDRDELWDGPEPGGGSHAEETSPAAHSAGRPVTGDKSECGPGRVARGLSVDL